MVAPQNRVNPAPVEERKTRAYELAAIHGKSYREIAKEMGVSTTTAHRMVKEAIAEIPPAERETHRRIAIERLEWLWARGAEQVVMGRDPVEVMPEMRQLVAQLSKLLGLNAPTQIAATVHEVDKLDVEIAELTREAEAEAALKEQRIRDR